MKFLKKSQLNFRNVKDNSVAIQITGEVTMDTPKGLTLPRGNTGDRLTVSDTGNLRGMIRYNTTTDEVEVYQGFGGRATWRSLRYKESTQIIQQDLGIGDDEEYIFGPLIPEPPTTDLIDDKSVWGGQNLLVFVENVMQLHSTNYVIIQNPCRVTGTIISFTASTKKITSSNTATINWVTRGYRIGQTITVAGTTTNNGTFTITNITASELTVSQVLVNESAGASMTVLGLSSSTSGQSHSGSAYTTGYYIQFQGPVPLGTVDPKHVTVLHGFDR
jgi:hypothetical protein